MIQLLTKNDLASFSYFQRLLLLTDGTVTDLLELHTNEHIQVNKIKEQLCYKPQELQLHASLLKNQPLPILERSILLQGQSTKQHWLYAESSVLINHLPEAFRYDLMHSKEPIGKLWLKYRLETFKSIHSYTLQPAGKIGRYFGLNKESPFITRTYHVFSNQKLIMLISEQFPTTSFQ